MLISEKGKKEVHNLGLIKKRQDGRTFFSKPECPCMSLADNSEVFKRTLCFSHSIRTDKKSHLLCFQDEAQSPRDVRGCSV